MENSIEIRPHRRLNVNIHLNPSSDTTIFLIHGLGGQNDQWREQIPLLQEKYTLIVPDLLGHGLSDKPTRTKKENPYSFVELEKDLEILFQKYASQHNIIIGHSYGGALATALAAVHAEQISRLILISPTPCVPSVTIPWIYHLPAWLMTLIRSYLEKTFVKLAFAHNDSEALIEKELLAMRQNKMYVIKNMVEGMKEVPILDVTQLTIPTLVMIGAEDQLIPPTLSRQFYKLLPYHTFKTIPKAAHLAQLETPTLVNDAIADFIQPEYILSPSMMDFSLSIK